MRKPELLVPASSLEVLKTAVRYGADAVYIGGEVFGLRAKAKNFTLEEMAEGVNFAHEHGVKVYVTANILAHNADLEPVKAYFNDLKKVNPDALIIADPAIFTIAKEMLPEMELHISTQANNTNYGTYNFWWNLGAKRVVSARELSIKEIKEIREHIPELIDAGIDSFKIEGRMKTALYVATVARTYRMAIDDYLEDPKKYEMNLPKYRTFISQCTYRQYTTGFFFGKPDETTQIYDCNVYERDYVYLGIVGDQVGEMEYSLEQKNKFYQGQKIEVMKADGNDIEVEVVSIKDEEGNEMESCPHPKQKLKINLGIELEKGDILRVKEQ